MRNVLISVLLLLATAAQSQSDAGCAFRLSDSNGTMTLEGLAMGPLWRRGLYTLEVAVEHAGGRSVSRQSGTFDVASDADQTVLSTSVIALGRDARLMATLWLTEGERVTSCHVAHES
ncbi:curli-like amyloid fiber formation chaperone CsgH [Loktanella sp. M215]|uniref:curli-like amyloid fiber formation chaperone CsgH n=1 Tax=Loktanella sp. M215 TaxID=2675431 RepID=UPI003FA5704F